MARNRAVEVAADYKNRGSGGKQQHFYPVKLDAAERIGLGLYKTEQGDNFLRILPPPDVEITYGRKICVHENIGTEQVLVLCPNRTHGEDNKPLGQPCPICEFATELYRADNQSKVAKALFAKNRWLYYVVNTKDEKTEMQGICWYSASSLVHDNVRDLSINPRDTSLAVDISDPKTGQDVRFKRAGIQFTAFQLCAPKAIPAEWYKDLPTFTDLLYFMSEDEILRHLATHSDKPVTEEETKNESAAQPEAQKQAPRSMPSRARVDVVETIQEEGQPTPPTSKPAAVAAAAPVEQKPVAEVPAVPTTEEKKGLSSQVQAKLAEFQKRRTAATQKKG